MRVKALSIWQPWASLIAYRLKLYETRSWQTPYRGPLLICASQNRSGLLQLPILKHRAKEFFGCSPIRQDMAFPLGVAVAIGRLTDCRPTGKYGGIGIDPLSYDMIFGDFAPGRFAWKLEGVTPIKPFPVKGRQGLFEVEIPGLVLLPGGGPDPLPLFSSQRMQR